MSTIASAESAALAPTSTTARRRAASTHAGCQQTFGRAIHAEWVKIRTLRSTWITAGIAMAITVLFGTGMSAGFASQPEYAEQAKYQIIGGFAFGMIVMAVLGALIVTGEYSSGQIRSSLAAVPNRGRLLVSKALVVSLLGFAIGTVSVFLSWALSLPFMKGQAGSLADPQYLGLLWGTGLAYAGVALTAMGLGYIMRSTAGSITVIVSLLFVVDVPLAIMSLKWDWVTKIQGVEQLVTAGAVSDPFGLTREWGVANTPAYLEHWQAIVVFGAWSIIPLLIGWIVFAKRDA